MSHLASYFLSVTASAVFASIIKSLFDRKTAAGAMIHLLCGLLVVLTLIRPVLSFRMGQLPEVSAMVWQEAAAERDRGEAICQAQLREVISEELQTYILTEARSFGAELQAVFSEWEGVRPESVTLTGRIAPYARIRLQQIIAQKLGIEKERQQWITP